MAMPCVLTWYQACALVAYGIVVLCALARDEP